MTEEDAFRPIQLAEPAYKTWIYNHKCSATCKMIRHCKSSDPALRAMTLCASLLIRDPNRRRKSSNRTDFADFRRSRFMLSSEAQGSEGDVQVRAPFSALLLLPMGKKSASPSLGSSDAGSLAGEERKQLAELEPGKGKRQESIRQPCYPNLWDSECAELIGMAARDLHAKYPKVLAGYMDIAKQRHGIDSTANLEFREWNSLWPGRRREIGGTDREALLNVEKQMRQAGDVAGTRKAVSENSAALLRSARLEDHQ
nr:26S proteasome non-ATPase regulatory subunit 12 homolog A-like [Ipomoea batatas]